MYMIYKYISKYDFSLEQIQTACSNKLNFWLYFINILAKVPALSCRPGRVPYDRTIGALVCGVISYDHAFGTLTSMVVTLCSTSYTKYNNEILKY